MEEAGRGYEIIRGDNTGRGQTVVNAEDYCLCLFC